MNDELLKLRGKYEILNDELRDLSAQIATEADAIAAWAASFKYCDRAMGEQILIETKDNAARADIVINRITRLREYHAQATERLARIKDLRPLVKK